MGTALDELSIVPGQLATDLSVRSSSSATQVTIRAANSRREVPLGLPVMVRQMTAKGLGESWTEFCGLLRKYGILVDSPAANFEQLPPAAVPLRLGKRFLDEPFYAAELQTADLLELSTRCRSTGNWGWPVEMGDSSRLKGMVAAVREAAGGNTPVGISLPLGVHPNDLDVCIDAELDFLTIVAPGNEIDDFSMWGIAKVRQVCQEKGQDLPLMVDARFLRVLDAVKCLLLGASVVSIDSLLEPFLKADRSEAAKRGQGMLSSIGGLPESRKGMTLIKLENKIREFRDALVQQMQWVGASDLSVFDRRFLRAATENCARLTGVPPLQE